MRSLVLARRRPGGFAGPGPESGGRCMIGISLPCLLPMAQITIQPAGVSGASTCADDARRQRPASTVGAGPRGAVR
jgi:hypothetical protein